MRNLAYRLSCVCALVASSATAAFVTAPEPQGVPELLVSTNGTRITNRTQWEAVRRMELLQIFREQEYGVRPVERPADLTFREIAASEVCFSGRAIRKRVQARYSGPGGTGEMTFSIWIPRTNRVVAAFIHSSPRPAETAADPKGPRPVYLLPAAEICARGYAVAAYCNQDVALDWQAWQKIGAATSGVFKVYGPVAADARKPTDWGILSAWGWGMSRVLDWMETEPLINAKRVGCVGLSRNGKTSLCAGVFDPRFALVVSCCSGCCGAKLNHMECFESETIKAISIARTWFCPNFMQYVGHDRDSRLPFDQHQFLALVAPRPLYVSSAIEDAWAGPRGEFAALCLASPAWGLYGLPTLEGEVFPAIDKPVIRGALGYHVRYGLHDITSYDWQRYMDFADQQGWNH